MKYKRYHSTDSAEDQRSLRKAKELQSLIMKTVIIIAVVALITIGIKAMAREDEQEKGSGVSAATEASTAVEISAVTEAEGISSVFRSGL